MRCLHNSLIIYNKNDQDNKETKGDVAERLGFEYIKDKNRNTYLEMVKIFVNRDQVHRRGHVEFIYSALKNMEQFGVHKDLQVYKALIDVLPKGKFIPQNIFQAEFMHYPKQQQCIVDLLEQMEDNGVIPDYDMEAQLLNIFGRRGIPLRKYWRMMYYMPKFKNLSPWRLPDPMPEDVFDLARLAIERISSVDVKTEITVYQTSEIKDAIDQTWIISAQSPTQRQLLQQHDVKKPVYVEGAFKVWLKGRPMNYFILRAEPKPKIDEEDDSDNIDKIQIPFFIKPPVSKKLTVIPSVHEQEDGVILALCATGTSSKDSLLSWIRHLEKHGNENLATIPVVFTLRSSQREIAKANNEDNNEREQIEDK